MSIFNEGKPLACGSPIVVHKNGRFFRHHDGIRISGGYEAVPASDYEMSFDEQIQSASAARRAKEERK